MAELTLNQAIGRIMTLDAAITNALRTEVSDEARQSMKEAAEEAVYSYQPKFLSRRKSDGGLIDDRNIICSVDGDTLTVDNVTGLQNLYGGGDTNLLTPIIENGEKSYHMPYPRAFIERTSEKLMSGSADRALREGLRRQGIHVDGGLRVGSD